MCKLASDTKVTLKHIETHCLPKPHIKEVWTCMFHHLSWSNPEFGLWSLQLEKQHSKLVKTQPLFVLSYHGHFIDSAAAFHAGVFERKIVPVFLTNTFILFSKQYLDTRNVNLLRICCAVAISICADVDQHSQFCSTLAGPPSSRHVTTQRPSLCFSCGRFA